MLIPKEPYELSEDAAAFVNEINALWDAAMKRRDRHALEAKRLAAIDPLAFSTADIKAKRRNADEAIELLQTEIPLLKRLLNWPSMRVRERSAAFDRVAQEQEDAATAIRVKLEELGFDPEAFANAFDDTPEGNYKRKLNADATIDAVTYFHPTVAPITWKLMNLSALKRDQGDDLRRMTEDQLAKHEQGLRTLIAQV